MGTRRLRNWWSLGAVIGIALVVAWLLYLLYQSSPSRRDDLATYGAFALSVLLIVVGWVAQVWRASTRRSDDAASADNLDHAAARLAAVVDDQWKKAAEERRLTGDPIMVTWGAPSQALAIPAAAAVRSRRFDPLPGLAPAGEADLASGQAAELHAVYGGLGSGRLIIAGPPGSGKSGTAVQLVLAALRHRETVSAEERPRVPVPVLFTAQDWDPADQPVVEWLAGKLQGSYPLFSTALGAETAAKLLAGGRIAVILDGLDEISHDLRPVALQALSQQATFRLVILSRTSEMAAAAASQGVLDGAAAVELSPVDPGEAASYLERKQLDQPPAGWQELTRRIRADPASPLSQALDNPLALTLVRDTYRLGDSVHELLDFCDTLDGMRTDQAVEAITGHLLDRILPAAYARKPGGKRLPYDLETAQGALTRIAAQMNQDGTRDINWWQIPAWLPRETRTTRTIASALATGAPAGLGGGLVFGLAAGPGTGLVFGLATGLVFGMAAGTQVWRESGRRNRPHVMADIRLTNAAAVKSLALGIALGLMAGIGLGLAAGIGLVIIEILTTDPDVSGSLSPATSWRRNQRYGLVFALAGPVAWLAVCLAAWLGAGVGGGIAGGIGIGIGLGLGGGLAFGLIDTASYAVSLASFQLTLGWGTPMNLMAFLEDAHERQILRAVGPAYQFRHARLQDRLAPQTMGVGHPGRRPLP